METETESQADSRVCVCVCVRSHDITMCRQPFHQSRAIYVLIPV